MGTILNEIFDNFGKFAEEQTKIEKPSFDQGQFGIITASQEERGDGVQTRYLDSSILITADDKDVLLEKRHPFGLETEDIIGLAHPEKANVGEGPKEAGVVDNLNDQQRKIINMVNKMPTGNVVHNFSFASEVAELVSIANELDDIGMVKEAEELTKVASELATLKKKL